MSQIEFGLATAGASTLSLCQMMTTKTRLEEFAGRFVLAPFRQRFVHEALKKPRKLHERICHGIEEIFPTRYKNGRLPFKSGDLVFPIIGTSRDLEGDCDWDSVSDREATGYGFLVASADLLHFYAETESGLGSPYRTYSNHT